MTQTLDEILVSLVGDAGQFADTMEEAIRVSLRADSAISELQKKAQTALLGAEKNPQKARQALDELANSLDKTAPEYAQLVQVLQDYDKQLLKVEESQRKQVNQHREFSDSIRTIGVSVTTVGVLVAGLFGSLSAMGLQYAGQFEKTQIAFETLMGSVEASRSMLGDLTKFAADTPYEMPEIQQAARGLIQFGESQEDVIKTLQVLGNAAAATSSGFSEVALIFNQVRGAGRLMAQDFYQLSSRGIISLQDLADHFGITLEEVTKLRSEGKISFEDLRAVLEGLSEEGGRFYNMMEKQSKSLLGLKSTLDDNIGIVTRELSESMIPLAKYGTEMLVSLTDALRELNPNTKALVGIMSGVTAVGGGMLVTVGGLIISWGGLTAAYLKFIGTSGSLNAALSANMASMSATGAAAKAYAVSIVEANLATGLLLGAGAIATYAVYEAFWDRINDELDEAKKGFDSIIGLQDEFHQKFMEQQKLENIGGENRQARIDNYQGRLDQLNSEIELLRRAKVEAQLYTDELQKKSGGLTGMFSDLSAGVFGGESVNSAYERQLAQTEEFNERYAQLTKQRSEIEAELYGNKGLTQKELETSITDTETSFEKHRKEAQDYKEQLEEVNKQLAEMENKQSSNLQAGYAMGPGGAATWGANRGTVSQNSIDELREQRDLIESQYKNTQALTDEEKLRLESLKKLKKEISEQERQAQEDAEKRLKSLETELDLVGMAKPEAEGKKLLDMGVDPKVVAQIVSLSEALEAANKAEAESKKRDSDRKAAVKSTLDKFEADTKALAMSKEQLALLPLITAGYKETDDVYIKAAAAYKAYVAAKETATEKEKAAKDALEAEKRLKQEGIDLTKKVMTAEEQLAERKAHYADMVQKGIISDETRNRALKEFEERAKKAKDAVGDLSNALRGLAMQEVDPTQIGLQSRINALKNEATNRRGRKEQEPELPEGLAQAQKEFETKEQEDKNLRKQIKDDLKDKNWAPDISGIVNDVIVAPMLTPPKTLDDAPPVTDPLVKSMYDVSEDPTLKLEDQGVPISDMAVPVPDSGFTELDRSPEELNKLVSQAGKDAVLPELTTANVIPEEWNFSGTVTQNITNDGWDSQFTYLSSDVAEENNTSIAGEIKSEVNETTVSPVDNEKTNEILTDIRDSLVKPRANIEVAFRSVDS